MMQLQRRASQEAVAVAAHPAKDVAGNILRRRFILRTMIFGVALFALRPPVIAQSNSFVKKKSGISMILKPQS